MSVKIYRDLRAFEQITRPVMEPDLYNLPIALDTPAMWFFPWRFDELLDLCKQFPFLHLISLAPDSFIRINRAVPKFGMYILADGDNNPNLIWVRKMSTRQMVMLRTSQFDTETNSAMDPEIHD